jgi:general secretion pathway protein C
VLVEPSNDPAFEAMFERIKKTSDTSYEIPGDVIEAVVMDPMPIAKGARIVPATKDGKPVGFKFYAIRPGSLFARIGLMNGDTLQAINGNVMDSADKAFDAYKQLRDATKLVIRIERRGMPIELTYTIKR